MATSDAAGVAPAPRRAPIDAVPSTVLVLGAVASVQTGASLAKSLFDDVGPGGTVLLRVLLAAIVLGAVWRPSVRGLGRKEVGLVLAYGIALAGWSSNSKYSLMGALRASAQMISYELSLGLSLVGVVLMSETLDLYSVVEQQSRFFGLHWNIIYQPLGFIIYLISAIAETNRVPFDLPEAETELVAGFHTEYSALKFALFFMAEYVNMFTVSVLATTLFLGGWNGPGVATFPVLGVFYFLVIMPQRKRQQALQTLISELKAGDRVVTSGGIIATITAVRDDSLIVRSADKSMLEISRGSVAGLHGGLEKKQP